MYAEYFILANLCSIKINFRKIKEILCSIILNLLKIRTK